MINSHVSFFIFLGGQSTSDLDSYHKLTVGTDTKSFRVRSAPPVSEAFLRRIFPKILGRSTEVCTPEYTFIYI